MPSQSSPHGFGDIFRGRDGLRLKKQPLFVDEVWHLKIAESCSKFGNLAEVFSLGAKVPEELNLGPQDENIIQKGQAILRMVLACSLAENVNSTFA